MATLAPASNPSSPSRRRRTKSCARRCERICWSLLTAFPLGFVYGLTTWAMWVQAHLGFAELKGSIIGHGSAFVGITFWTLLNWSYTVAVFTNAGTTTSGDHGYSSLPSREPVVSSLTAKSTGEHRFCKKCQARKPDRAHHCSSCKRCVLKMDHHCPWLATCVGFRNYKPFVLFLVYTCAFCYTCFLVTLAWVWTQFVTGGDFDEQDGIMPVQYILLCVLAGIIGLVLSGFTGWHIYLATQGQTTIESLEKTRYLTPVRNAMQHQQQRHYIGEDEEPSSPRLLDQVVEAHANALPGVTRPEDGEDRRESPMTARQSLQRSYSQIEEQREHDRYAAYLDEQDSEKMPNAFDHGWKRNMRHVFGETPLLWIFPICNTTGDGWNWEASPRWLEAREELARERQAREREEQAFKQEERGWAQHAPTVDFRSGQPSRNGYDKRFTNSVPQSDYSMNTLPSRGSSRPNSSRPMSSHDENYSSDEDSKDDGRQHLLPRRSKAPDGQWNDLPQDMISSRNSSRGGVRTRSPRPARAYPNG